MTSEESIRSYLQADGAQRQELFAGFLKALGHVRDQRGPEAATASAVRAVSPLLDYSSLSSLRRFVRRSASAAAPLRLAVLGGPTTIQLTRFLDLFLAAMDIPCSVYEGEYALFRQEILDPGSGLARFEPQLLFIATGAGDISRWPEPAMDRSQVQALLERETEDWATLWQSAHDRWQCSIIQNTAEIPPWDALGHYAARHSAGRSNYLQRLNLAFAERAPRFVTLHDMEKTIREAGSAEWFDPRFYLEAKMPCAPECLVPYAHSVASLVRALRGKSKKAIVLDLDNTLWGGVVGDDGVGGIQFGQGSALGEAYLAFQTYLKDLSGRGVLLAVCSKNDPDNAREPFERREDMVLRLDDFACFIANWNSKADNVREISARLNLDADAMVFLDDNPAERALIRRFVPELAVPDLPADPAGYIAALARWHFFETCGQTEEDARRSTYYAQESQRQALAREHYDLDGFLASLDMRASVQPIDETSAERATQLINKTNQFNLTNRRYTLAQVEALASSTRWRTLTVRLRDTLGDSGIVAVVLLRTERDAIEIDNWVMSCRVFQRGVEAFTFNEVLDLARREGAKEIRASYVPSAKNSMVADHYRTLGFEAVGQQGPTVVFRFAVGPGAPQPTHIQMESLT